MKNINWRSFGHPLNIKPYRRTIFVRTGYDHRKEFDGYNRGWHNDEWVFVIGRDRGALCLSVNSGQLFGEPLPQELESDKQGTDLTLHLSFPSTPKEVLSEPGDDCCWLEGKCFQPYSTALGARDFWPESVNQKFDDVGRFYPFNMFPWECLAERFEELYTQLLQANAELPHRCLACGGKGLVSR